jgi:hypothetical protein
MMRGENSMNMQLLQDIGAELVAHRVRFSRAVDALTQKARKAHRASIERGVPYRPGADAAAYFEPALRDMAQRVYDAAERYRRAGAQEAPGAHGARYVTHQQGLDREISKCLAELRGEA